MKHTIITGLVFMASVAVSFNANGLEVLIHNPFEQPNMSAAQLMNANQGNGNEMKLRGTVIDGKDSLANIGGKFYRLNQEIADYHVVRIESTSETLRRGDNETVLTLHDE